MDNKKYFSCVFEAKISKSINNSTKIVRVSQYNRNPAYSDIFWIDIRTFTNGRATKSGICLLPSTYKWMISQIKKNKKHGIHDEVNRTLRMRKCDEGILLKLSTAYKEVEFKLFNSEIR